MKSIDKQIQELKEIKNLMEKSSRFLSLSGLSAIFAGLIALIGAFIAYYFILDNGRILYDEYFQPLNKTSLINIKIALIIDALAVFVLAIIGAVYFSMRKAKKQNLKFWSNTTKRILYNFSLPLLVGGLFIIILILQNNIHLVASATLIFYGLALLNASKYTFGEIHYLGLSEIVLGLAAGIFLYYGIFFWAVGFGLLHIVYGWVMYYKYEK